MPQEAKANEEVLGRSVLGGAACGLSFAGASFDALARSVGRGARAARRAVADDVARRRALSAADAMPAPRPSERWRDGSR